MMFVEHSWPVEAQWRLRLQVVCLVSVLKLGSKQLTHRLPVMPNICFVRRAGMMIRCNTQLRLLPINLPTPFVWMQLYT